MNRILSFTEFGLIFYLKVISNFNVYEVFKQLLGYGANITTMDYADDGRIPAKKKYLADLEQLRAVAKSQQFLIDFENKS